MRTAVRGSALLITGVLLTTACTREVSTVPVSDASPRSGLEVIVQPQVTDLEVAPESARVDLQVPVFSDPTNITNPLFPVSIQESVLLLGKVDGQAFRTEVSLLPDTRIIEWEGQRVEVLVSQYVAFLDGRIHEVAYDLYAQDDDGAVWYFGEDVFNFADGKIVDTHGTWIAGKDGPAAMIMPADPRVGDVYRPENIPGFVFEEVTVRSVGEALRGPLGPVDGGLLVEELHMGGNTEAKTFAPGYGEFFTSGGGDTEALALAVPTDASSDPLPEELASLKDAAMSAFDAASSADWGAATRATRDIKTAWETYAQGEVPVRIAPRLTKALDALSAAVRDKDASTARQMAIDVAQSALDLQLLHRSPVEVDLERFDLWLRQLSLDVDRADMNAVNGDFFTLDYIRDRILHVFAQGDTALINGRLEVLHEAVSEGDLRAAARAAERLRSTIDGLTVSP